MKLNQFDHFSTYIQTYFPQYKLTLNDTLLQIEILNSGHYAKGHLTLNLSDRETLTPLADAWFILRTLDAIIQPILYKDNPDRDNTQYALKEILYRIQEHINPDHYTYSPYVISITPHHDKALSSTLFHYTPRDFRELIRYFSRYPSHRLTKFTAKADKGITKEMKKISLWETNQVSTLKETGLISHCSIYRPLYE